ncbi:MAG: hypothetical protein GC129_06800 [Proteobacteria bacterium]|nr:hypothetical protein [Pseudomonadota bacterium]
MRKNVLLGLCGLLLAAGGGFGWALAMGLVPGEDFALVLLVALIAVYMLAMRLGWLLSGGIWARQVEAAASMAAAFVAGAFLEAAFVLSTPLALGLLVPAAGGAYVMVRDVRAFGCAV